MPISNDEKIQTTLTTIADDAIEVLGSEESNVISVTEGESVGGSEHDLCNTFNLNLRTSALSVQMQTKTVFSPMITELTIKLECALSRVNETDDRLTNAIYRIGYLEAQLVEKDKLIAEIKQKNNAQQ